MSRRSNVSNEIILNVAQQSQMSFSFLVLMAMAGVLTTTALLTNSIPTLIGAMVIAPVMAPLQLVAFGLVGGQWRLALRGLGTAVIGLSCSILFTFITAWLLMQFEIVKELGDVIYKPLLDERVRPGNYSVIVAIAAGFAGTLAMAEKKIDALVGVVAAVALVPAAGAGAISLMAGDLPRAIGGFSLFAINFILILGVAIVTLALFGRVVESKSGQD